ncbi:MAG: NUDIX domain-containing protein [Flavobacteriales bacterium]|nr:NUDIX domain-containing protein [Flavobacteriales bacterium]
MVDRPISVSARTLHPGDTRRGGALSDDLPDSAKRELREEAGLTARKWTLIQEMDLSNSATDERALLYLAQDLTEHEPDPCGDRRDHGGAARSDQRSADHHHHL